MEPPRVEGEGAMSKKWYIVHTYSGQEARAKQALLDRASSLGHEDSFAEILIPDTAVHDARAWDEETLLLARGGHPSGG